MAEAENGSGALFKNDKKATTKHPDYTGNFVLKKDLLKAWIEEFKKDPSVTELKVQLGAWIRQSGSKTFLSLSVNAPFEKKAPRKDDLNDDVPF